MAEIPKESVRLPRSVIPEKYELHYSEIQLEEPFRFAGTTTISLAVRQTTNVITLHAQNLKITKAILIDSTGSSQVRHFP